jgi:F-type H+-transporting ATPase subunit b
MLDLEPKWMLTLLCMFLGLVYLLNVILFRPLLAVFKERDDSVKGSLAAAKEMDGKKEEGLEKMNKELSEARQKAKDVFEKLREEGLNRQKVVLKDAESQASSMLQRAREELRAEAAKARVSLKADAEKFSDEIVRKLVKA